MSTKQDPIELGSWRSWHSEEVPVRVGISACLLGEEVRYNGGHARDRFVTEVLGEWLEPVSVCPEVEVGMGVPRPTVRLVDNEEGPRMVDPESGHDYTQPMREYAERRVGELAASGLDGFILKKNSPSCGMERIKVHGPSGPKHKNGVGLFAARLMSDHPHLPVEEDGRLNDPLLRENFIERIFCHNRWRNLLHRGIDRGSLVAFHTAHKLLIWSHNEAGMRRLGTLVGSAGSGKNKALFAAYEAELHQALVSKATPKRHTNVLQHAFGYLKRDLDPRDKQQILTALEDYRTGLLPLVVPLTLLRFNIQKYEVEYLLGQLYFDPHPKELQLRNHS